MADSGTDVDRRDVQQIGSDEEDHELDAIEDAMGAELIAQEAAPPKRSCREILYMALVMGSALIVMGLLLTFVVLLKNRPDSIVPSPPGSGVYVLRSADGELDWVTDLNYTLP